jgi:hypothetical protein
LAASLLMETFWRHERAELPTNGTFISEKEVDHILDDNGEFDYMKSKWLLYPICNALII